MEDLQRSFVGQSALEMYKYFIEWRYKLLTRYLVILSGGIASIYLRFMKVDVVDGFVISVLFLIAFVSISFFFMDRRTARLSIEARDAAASCEVGENEPVGFFMRVKAIDKEKHTIFGGQLKFGHIMGVLFLSGFFGSLLLIFISKILN